VQKGDEVIAAVTEPVQHWTKPPGRLTEGTLVKALEEAGVGRPSTYAPIIRVLQASALPAVSAARLIWHNMQRGFKRG